MSAAPRTLREAASRRSAVPPPRRNAAARSTGASASATNANANTARAGTAPRGSAVRTSKVRTVRVRTPSPRTTKGRTGGATLPPARAAGTARAQKSSGSAAPLRTSPSVRIVVVPAPARRSPARPAPGRATPPRTPTRPAGGRRRTAPDRGTPARRSPHRRTRPALRPASSPRRAQRHSVAFWVCSGLLIAGLVLGLVTLSAMVAQSSFSVDDLGARVQQLQQDARVKRKQVAHLTAPERIAAAAGAIGLHLPAPGAVQVIHVAGSGPRSVEGTG